jgi:hypothetical protein
MNDKPMTINMVKDGKPITIVMSIVDLVKKVGINDPLLDVIVKQANKLNLRNDATGEEFIISKHDELKAYVNANKKDGTTLDELKILISGWIVEQDRIGDEMEQVEAI